MSEQPTETSFRRLVTGNGADGRSRLIDDRRVTESSPTNFNHWMTLPNDRRSDREALEQAQPFYAGPGQTLMRMFAIPPDDPAMAPEQFEAIAAGFFASYGISDCRVDASRHPMMHKTPTTDYVILLSGQASLLLDDGEPVPLKPFDVVVQRGTNHAWVNTGKAPAVFIAVMVGPS
jgi:mannose-6-phosphate isomerase-like protein (cupin superfamily)